MPADSFRASRKKGRAPLVGTRMRRWLAMLVLGLLPGCLPLLAPHGEVRGTLGFAAGRTRTDAADGVRLAGNVDAVYLPTQLLGCDRDVDIGLGARFHFVEPDVPGVRPERVGGVVSGTWIFHRAPALRGELRFDVDVLTLENRPLVGASVALGLEVIGFTEGTGAWAGWEGLFVGAWSGEAALRVEAMVGYHEDFGGVHYATFTLGLGGRWPAGAGVAIVNPVYLAVAAAQAAAPATSPTTTPSPTPASTTASSTSGEIRGCPDLLREPITHGEAAADSDERMASFRCVLADETVSYLDAPGATDAMTRCQERFEVPCTCAPR